jgi:hypothetical protein
MPRPIPLVEPVTMATRPESRRVGATARLAGDRVSSMDDLLRHRRGMASVAAVG